MDEEIESCTIVTCGSNGMMKRYQDRLPVILPKDLWDAWLDPEVDPKGLKDLLVPWHDGELQFRPASKQMNSTRGKDYHYTVLP